MVHDTFAAPRHVPPQPHPGIPATTIDIHSARHNVAALRPRPCGRGPRLATRYTTHRLREDLEKDPEAAG